MARSGGGGAGTVVAGLMAAALAVVGFFTFQASAAQHEQGATHRPDPGDAGKSSGDHEHGRGHSGGSGGTDGPGRHGRQDATALPDRSGHGQRVVYGLRGKRVWLVGSGGRVTRTYRVRPGNVSPRPGAYRVRSRSLRVTGSDGVPVEHVVRFAVTRGATIGFSAAVGGARSTPGTGGESGGGSKKAGGVRESRKDGKAMWLFATTGTKVVVVP